MPFTNSAAAVYEGIGICLKYNPNAKVVSHEGYIVVFMQTTGVISLEDNKRLKALGWQFDGDEEEWIQIPAFYEE